MISRICNNRVLAIVAMIALLAVTAYAGAPLSNNGVQNAAIAVNVNTGNNGNIGVSAAAINVAPTVAVAVNVSQEVITNQAVIEPNLNVVGGAATPEIVRSAAINNLSTTNPNSFAVKNGGATARSGPF